MDHQTVRQMRLLTRRAAAIRKATLGKSSAATLPVKTSASDKNWPRTPVKINPDGTDSYSVYNRKTRLWSAAGVLF